MNQAESVLFDERLELIYAHFQSKPNLRELVGEGLRQSIDEVIDGPRTGRYCIEQLEKTEKTYIGTKVEIVLRKTLKLERGDILDNKICGIEVDTKFSISGNWMIPREALDQICLLVKANDNRRTFSIGLLRTTKDALSAGTNQDSKHSVSAKGKACIRWLLLDQTLPANILLQLDSKSRNEILNASSGPARMRALFRNAMGILIPRSVILQVGQQDDSLKRARETKAYLEREGLLVLCAKYKEDRAKIIEAGFSDFNDNDWLSIRI